MTIWTALWIVWGAAFAGIEGFALRADAHGSTGATLSEHLRRWFHVNTHVGRTIWLIVSGIWGVAFAMHIANGGWF